MLDKNTIIEQIDSDNTRDVITAQPDQLRYAFDVTVQMSSDAINAVVVVGMGGSALAAQMVQTWWFDQLTVPFVIVRGYDMPAFVDKNTLVIFSSYSGNTEETVNAYDQVQQRGASAVVMTSGGQLAARAATDEAPLYQLPEGYQPRMAVWYGLRALSELFEQLGLVEGATSQLEAASGFLASAAEEWTPDIPTEQNRAKQIAEECLGKAVWVYAGPKLRSAAYKWKIAFNENAKHVASWNELPEFNHNELLGWTEHPRHKPFSVIQLQSGLDDERIGKRFEISNRLLSGRMPAPLVVESRGETHIQHLLWTCLLGDFASLYLAVLNNVNPARIEVIEQLKQQLASGDADSG